MRSGLLWILGAALLVPAAATAQGVPVISRIYVERTEMRGGLNERVVEPATALRQGDRVITVLQWKAPTRGSYTITSAVPRGLAFAGASSTQVEVSRDGGGKWTRLEMQGDLSGITHLRWRTRPGDGSMTYRAIVR